MPRVLVLSFRHVDRGPWLTQLMALEDLVVEAFGADVVFAEPPRGRLGAELLGRGRARALVSRMGYRTTHLSDGPPSRPYDLMISLANDVPQVRQAIAEALPDLPRYAQQRCLYLSEVWPSEVRANPDVFRVVLGAFTHVFTSLESSVDPLRGIADAPVHLLPTGADVTAMAPWPASRPPIDVTSLGRKTIAQHEALTEWARRTNRFYFFDATPPGDVPDFRLHREALANHLVHSAAWVTNSARQEDVRRTEGIQEVGLRFYEALAGGCLMLGEVPLTSRTFEEHFADLPGIVLMAAGAHSVPEDLDRILDDDRLLRRARMAHRRRALQVGDIAHMLVAMLGACDVSPPAALAGRLDRLAAEASALKP